MHIQLGNVLTPELAGQRGIQLSREREHHTIKVNLFRESTRSGPVFYITVSHIVMTVTVVERVAQWAFLHS